MTDLNSEMSTFHSEGIVKYITRVVLETVSVIFYKSVLIETVVHVYTYYNMQLHIMYNNILSLSY